MPHYDYVCNGCDHEFELYQSITAAVKRKCPNCGQLKLRRLIGPGAAVMFKGSGFYQTDYRSDSYKKGAKAEKEAAGNGKQKKKEDKTPKKETTSDTTASEVTSNART